MKNIFIYFSSFSLDTNPNGKKNIVTLPYYTVIF